MKFNRQFEKKGPLWTPKYDWADKPSRFDKYKERYQPKAAPQFGHVQGTSNGGFVVQETVTWGSLPTAGNLMCVAVVSNKDAAPLTNSSLVSIADGNGVVFSFIPGAVGVNRPTPPTGSAWIGYAIVPSSPSSTVVVTMQNVANPPTITAYIEEFSIPAGYKPVFDTSASDNTHTTTTEINLPSITPSFANSLLWCVAAVQNNVSVQWTAPTPTTPTLGIWTVGAGSRVGAGGGSSTQNIEYSLNVPASSQTIDFTLTATSTGWVALVASFYLVSTGDTFTLTGQYQLK